MLTDDEIKELALKHSSDNVAFARAIIAAYQDKLRQGVELPEGLPAMKWQHTMLTRDQLLQYGDARDQAGYLRGLETALLKVTGLSVDVERCKQLQLTTQAWEEALGSAADAIEKLIYGRELYLTPKTPEQISAGLAYVEKLKVKQ